MLNKTLLSCLSLLLLATAAITSPEPLPLNLRGSRAAVENAPAIPLAFEKNSGQAASDTLYLANGGGRAVALKADHASMYVEGVEEPFVMRWVGAADEVEIEALEKKRYTKNYIVGTDENAWVEGVRSYGRIRYHEVYPHIDLDFYTLDGKLEYDFIVHPGGDPSRIALRFEGTEAELDAKGALRLDAVAGAVWHAPPYVYQDAAGRRTEIRGAFRDDGETFGFDLGEYDEQTELVIDPVFGMASFLGGEGDEFLVDGLFDSRGDLWWVGLTDSSFPELQGLDGTDGLIGWHTQVPGPGPRRWQLDDLTVIGGLGNDTAGGIVEGQDGVIYIGGHYDSQNHPAGVPQGNDVWVAREEPTDTGFQRTIVSFGGTGDQFFSGFPRPPHPAHPGDFHFFDPDGDGASSIFWSGTSELPGQLSFNNLTQLDAVILQRLREWHLLKQAEGTVELGGMAFDPGSGNMICTGSSDTDLVGADKPGNPGIFKQFIASINVSAPTPSSFTGPVPINSVTFINDGSAAATDIFIDDLDLIPVTEADALEVLTFGTQRQGGAVSGIVDRIGCVSDPTILCVNHQRFQTEAGWNYTGGVVDSTMNAWVSGHQFDGDDRRLGLRQFGLGSGNVLNDAVSPEAGFGVGSAVATSMSRNLIAFLGAAEPNQGFDIDATNMLQDFQGGLIDGYLAILDCLQLNPNAVVTAGQFEWGPIVPYGAYTAFIDWTRIPGLILPPLVDGRFPKSVEGLELLLNGEPAAITALSPTQVNFIAHGGIVVGADCTLQLRYVDPGTAEVWESNTITMPTAPTWFNAFEIGGAAALIHANGIMSRDNPIPFESAFALFGGGLGTFGNPEIEACDLTPSDEIFNADSSLPRVEAVVEDGTRFDVELIFAGPSPGSSPSLGQLNGIISDAFWTFCAATTNVEFTIVVTDTETGQTMEYFDPIGQAAPAVTDTQAFATCP